MIIAINVTFAKLKDPDGGNMQKYQWEITDHKPEDVENLVKNLSISPILAQILVNRGIVSVKDAKAFLYADIRDITLPSEILGMAEAVEIITKSISLKHKIAVYGDYDADGITSTYVLSYLLKKAGALVVTYIPNRMDEGYGLNYDALQKLIDDDVKLVITVDCGISAVEEIAFAKANGLECIITDHHTPPEKLPCALAIVNPKIYSQNQSVYDLAGVGVAWKTGWGVLEKILNTEVALHEALNVLDIVAVGTVADLVKLTGENRIIVKYGLRRLENTENIGLRALINDAGIDGKVDTYRIGFMIGPRLNAAGRMSNADKALKLLQAEEEPQARAWAALLSAENTSRQDISKEIFDEAEACIKTQIHPDDKVIVLASSTWHEGVVGIVASKILEKNYLPVICLAIKENEAKGSARSIIGFNMFDAINACSKHTLRFGGHAMAAGLSLSIENIDHFRIAINAYAKEIITSEMLINKKNVDCEVKINEITPELLKELTLLEPHGQGNEKPVMMLRNGVFNDKHTMGKNSEHLRFNISQNSCNLAGVAWGKAENSAFYSGQGDLLINLQERKFNNKTTMQAVMIDFRQHKNIDYANFKKSIVLQRLVNAGKTTWDVIQANTRNNLFIYFPDKKVLSNIYKILECSLLDHNTLSRLQRLAEKSSIPWESFYLALVIFYELKLIAINKEKNEVNFTLLPRPLTKISLENSPLYIQIEEEYNLLKGTGSWRV